MLSEFFTAIHDGFSSLHKRVTAVEKSTVDELGAVKARLQALEKPFSGLTTDMIGKIRTAYGHEEQNPSTVRLVTDPDPSAETK